MPTTIAINGSVRVNAYLKSAGGDVVALTQTITNNSTEVVEFGRAKYHTLKCGFSSTDVITYWTNFTADNFAGGYGSEGAPYQISTAAELALLAKMVNDGTTSYTGKTFTLTQNIDLSGHDWIAIGQFIEDIKDNKFQGIFDGAGHKITGLYLNQAANVQGLFGFIEGATIKDLSVSGSVTGNEYVSGVVGAAIASTITNCHNCCSVETTINDAIVGGVVGASIASTITNCYNSGSVEGAIDYVGGVVGLAEENSTITNCYNSGSVKGGNSASTNVGGIAGLTHTSTITNCYNSGSVEGGAYANVGGIVGTVEGDSNTITHCYWDESKCTAGFSSETYDVKGMTTNEMKESSFVTLLNSNASEYNNTTAAIKACAWVAGTNGYPTLNFGVMPVTE